MVNEVDADGNGTIGFDEFVELIIRRQSFDQDPEQEL